MLFDKSLYDLGLSQQEMSIAVFAVLALILIDLIRYLRGKALDEALAGQCLWFRWGVLLFLLSYIMIFGIYGPAFEAKQFIYFQF